MRRALKVLHVRTGSFSRTRGWLVSGPFAVPIVLGRGGIRANKREGDGATPRGSFRLVRLWWRADRIPRPRTALPVRRITATDAWCENPADRRYNRPIVLSPRAVGDRLMRTDRLYDLIVELDHNTRPRIAGRGSAVFVHVARPGFAPTAGCVAMTHKHLKNLLNFVGPDTLLKVQ